MIKEIEISVEKQSQGNWIKIIIPYNSPEPMLAILLTETGEVLKKVRVSEGCNSIDISNLYQVTFNIKIETPYQTILKKLNLNK